MAEDWSIDVRKYAPDADESVIAGIVRHCGIALQSRDASLVSFTDPAETDRVRESFLRRKLGLTNPDAELDAAIARVGERMSADHTKNRVTVYYLLAEMFGRLGLFGGASEPVGVAAGDKLPDAEPLAVASPPPPPRAPVPAPPPPAPPVGASTVAAAAVPVTGATAAVRRARRGDDGMLGTALTALAAMGVIILGAATVGSLVGERMSQPAAAVDLPVPASPEVAAVPAPVAPAIPEGSGVVAQELEGRPQVSVYFDTASADVSPDFAAAAAPIKAYLDANPGARLAVSGYNDPRGDAAFNAELSKNRAQSVAAALTALGVPEASIDLEKPVETTDTTTSFENARRVDILVRDAG